MSHHVVRPKYDDVLEGHEVYILRVPLLYMVSHSRRWWSSFLQMRFSCLLLLPIHLLRLLLLLPLLLLLLLLLILLLLLLIFIIIFLLILLLLLLHLLLLILPFLLLLLLLLLFLFQTLTSFMYFSPSSVFLDLSSLSYVLHNSEVQTSVQDPAQLLLTAVC